MFVCIIIKEQIPFPYILTRKNFKIERVCVLILNVPRDCCHGVAYDLAVWTCAFIVLLQYACL